MAKDYPSVTCCCPTRAVAGNVRLPKAVGECYSLGAPAFDDGTHILFEFGLLLPKRADFDPGTVRGDEFSAIRSGFCIDESGSVVSYGF